MPFHIKIRSNRGTRHMHEAQISAENVRNIASLIDGFFKFHDTVMTFVVISDHAVYIRILLN